MTHEHDWVFGYGSLVSDVHPVRIHLDDVTPRWAMLRDVRRSWNIAMQNAGPEHDSKHYVDAVSGERPNIAVAFLNVVRDPSRSVNGLAIPVPSEKWGGLDEREVNYERRDVTERVAPKLPGRVWCYVGLPEAEASFREAARANDVYVADEYKALVDAAFAKGGPQQHAAYLDSTDPPECPIRRLRLRRL